MLWRHLRLVRAWSAAGLFSLISLGSAVAGDISEPVPSAETQAETVKILDAQKTGDLAVDLRGHGQAQVKMAIKNNSKKRLNVVLPPGLVASAVVAQGAAGGGGGGGGGFQNMGLGAPNNRPGGFGQFNANGNGNGNAVGFRSVGVSAPNASTTVTVPAGASIDVDMPAVCLNFGLPTPSGKDRFKLVDVDDYSRDPRVRKALRSLVSMGTSQGTAQAAMWSVCNNIPFETMISQGEKVVNRHEVVLASRFIEALDASSSSDLVDPAYLTEARVFVTVVGEKGLEKDALRLASEMDGLRVLGLPVRMAVAKELPKASSPALHLVVNLTGSKVGETTAKVAVRYATTLGQTSEWQSLGQTGFKETSAASALKGIDIARSVDHAVASAFVTARASRKSAGSTTIRIENRLPFSLANVSLKAGNSSGAPVVAFNGLGIGPVRSTTVTIPAPSATVDRVELNGL